LVHCPPEQAFYGYFLSCPGSNFDELRTVWPRLLPPLRPPGSPVASRKLFFSAAVWDPAASTRQVGPRRPQL